MSEVAQLISQTLEQERRQRELLEQHYAQYDADDDEVSGACKHPSCLSSHRVPTLQNSFPGKSRIGSLQFLKENVSTFNSTENKYYLHLLLTDESSNGILFTA